MFVKTEMTGTIFSNPTDEIYVIDRAGEYTEIARRFGGSVYDFGVGTGVHLNPFDTTTVSHTSRAEQLSFKIDATLAQAGASAEESGQPLSEVDQSIIQRCVELAFDRAEERGDGLPPTLQDFYDIAKEQPERQAQVIALKYERFVKGTMDFFNHQTNLKWDKRIIDFNLKNLPDSMLVFASSTSARRSATGCTSTRSAACARGSTWRRCSRSSPTRRCSTTLAASPTKAASSACCSPASPRTPRDAGKRGGAQHRAQRGLHHAPQAVAARPYALDGAAEPLRAGGGVHRRERGGGRRPAAGWQRAGAHPGKFPSGNVLYDLFSTNPNEAKQKKKGKR